MNLLIDSHAHLTDKAFAEVLAAVLDRAAGAGIDRIVTVAESLEDAQRVRLLADGDDMLVATAGVHPHRADSWTDESAARLAALAQAGGVVAIGETGLDHHYDFSTPENQQRAFREQVRLAKTLGLPLIVHCRDAEDALAGLLAAEAPFPAGGVVHCFCGNAAQADRLLALGFHLGVGGMVTFRKADEIRRVAAEAIPPERLLIETDAPYLAPVPQRGRRNEPAFVVHVAEALARLRSTELPELAAQTRRNALALFGLGPEIPPARIAYVLRRSLYLNLTNRCTNDCVFCRRTRACGLGGHDLRLPREPSSAEVIASVGEHPDGYDEVVFCGYGEPTLRLSVLLRVGRWLKSKGVRRVRLNTNGHGNAIHGRSIVGELAPVIDSASVSLNAATPEDYARLCRPGDPRYALDAVCRFVDEAKGAIREVVASAVACPGADLDACRRLAEETLGVPFLCRGFHART